MTDFMEQAQQMQSRMMEMQKKLATQTVEGEAGAGSMKITLTGKGDMTSVVIDPAVVDPEDVELLEDLIIAAFTDAKTKLERLVGEITRSVMGDIQLPEGFGSS